MNRYSDPKLEKLNEIIAAEKIQIIQRFDFSAERPMSSAEKLDRLFLQLAEVDKKYSGIFGHIISPNGMSLNQQRTLQGLPPIDSL